MDNSDIDRIRRFNRFVTLRAGALDTSYLGRGRPLGEARILFEIGQEGCDLKTLRTRLDVDSGYLSRIVASLEAQGLVSSRPDPADRRKRRLVLTERGRSEHAAYDELSNELAGSMLAKLGPSQRECLTTAMATVEKLMMAASVEIAIEPADSRQAQACLDAYFHELDARFEGGFDIASAHAGAAATASEDIFMMARLARQPIGCVTLRLIEADMGEIKRMWVAPEARGLGVSRRLLHAVEAEAHRLKLGRIRLDTNAVLSQARKLYQSSGYKEIARYNDNPFAQFWFEKMLGTRSG